MDELTTAFQISRWSNGVLGACLMRLLVGVCIVAIGVYRHGRVRRGAPGETTTLHTPRIIIGLGIVWICFHAFFLLRIGREAANLTEIYLSRRCQVVEGPVQVLQRQPADGSGPGDIVEVGDRRFSINYFEVTPAYRQTIARGGVLTDGRFARLYHDNGRILRVDVAMNEGREKP